MLRLEKFFLAPRNTFSHLEISVFIKYFTMDKLKIYSGQNFYLFILLYGTGDERKQMLMC